MWIARIARPGALNGASVAETAFGDVNRAIGNPSVVEEVVGANVANDKENLKGWPNPGLCRISRKTVGRLGQS